MEAPIYLYAFWAPIHESTAVQVMLVAVLILIVADLAFGMLGAIVQKDFKSTKIREGLAHKCSEFAFLLVADVIDALNAIEKVEYTPEVGKAIDNVNALIEQLTDKQRQLLPDGLLGDLADIEAAYDVNAHIIHTETATEKET